MAKRIRGTLTKSSAVISNLAGPIQQMALANHPVKGLYFTLAGGPEVCILNPFHFSINQLNMRKSELKWVG